MEFWRIEMDWINEDLSTIDLADLETAELFLAMPNKPKKRRGFNHGECGHLGNRRQGLHCREGAVALPIRAAA